MGFKVEGPWNTKKGRDKKNFWILDALEWLKQQHFDLGDSVLIVPACKLFLFFYFHPPKLFYKKGVLKNFANFIRKHLCTDVFL